APVAIQWNQNIVAPGYFVVPKGAPNRDLAMKFIAFATSAEHNAGPSKHIPYGPVNVNALDKADPETAPRLQSNYGDVAFFPDDLWYDANREEVSRYWTEWVSGVR